VDAVLANANDSRLENSVRSRSDFVNKNVFLNLVHVTNEWAQILRH
jgi:hypothetical protein